MSSELRQRAEALLKATPGDTPMMSTADAQNLVYEMQVHHVELEMQNDELRQAQIDLAQVHDAYAELYDFAPIGYLTLDPAGVILTTNHAAAAMFGLERGRLLNRKFSDFVRRDDQDDWFRHRQSLTTSGGRETVELALQRADAVPFFARLESSPRPSASPEDWCFMMAVIDVTRRHAAEEKLRGLNIELEQRVALRTAELAEAEAKFRSLAEQSPNMIYISCQGRIVYANPACEKVTGYTQEEIHAPDFDFQTVVSPGSADDLRTDYELGLIGEQPVPREFTLVSKNGHRIEVIRSIKAIDYRGDRATLGTLTDIRARKKAERLSIIQHRRLQQLTAKLTTAQDLEQRRIAEGLHDDVAQLLTSCSVKLALLTKIEDVEKLRALHNKIGELISEANEKVHSLSFELGDTTLLRLGLNEAVGELCDGLKARHGIRFVQKSKGDINGLNEEAALGLFKALRELLFNVIKHAGVKEALVKIEKHEDHIRVDVQDHGKGFPLAYKGSGDDLMETGIGLLGVRERMRGFGGRMQIESKPDVGTRVALWMPLVVPE